MHSSKLFQRTRSIEVGALSLCGIVRLQREGGESCERFSLMGIERDDCPANPQRCRRITPQNEGFELQLPDFFSQRRFRIATQEALALSYLLKRICRIISQTERVQFLSTSCLR